MSKDEISALRLLLKEELRSEIGPFQEEFRQFRDEVQQSFDALFQRDEKREQEYLVMREQVARLERKVA